jgi:hypothetical protein
VRVLGAVLAVMAGLALFSFPLAHTTAGASRATSETPARLLVSADEYRLTLSRQRLVAGTAIVQLLNRGEDDHDLRLRPFVRTGRSPRRSVNVEVAAPGRLVERTVRLKPARYRLWCSLPGHRGLGMRGVLRVSRARSSR